jgi:class 3 adenylate cyclase
MNQPGPDAQRKRFRRPLGVAVMASKAILCGKVRSGAATSFVASVALLLPFDVRVVTARSDRADPEDVGAMLRPFHARLGGEIERVGGTLDKLIGDAVMAVFGVPAVHEDDPEQGGAVRAAQGVVGDVVNTAARLQGVAPVNGVVVREATWRATPSR